MARNHSTNKIGQFHGLRDADDAYEVGLDGLVSATNIDITRRLRPMRRPGYTRVYSGNVDSFWADEDIGLFVDGANLNRLNANFTATLIRSDMKPAAPLTAHRVGSLIYYSNGAQLGVYDVLHGGRSLGVAQMPAFSLSVAAGELPAGTYQVTATLVNQDGREGGAPRASVIALTGTRSGIQVSGLTLPDATYKTRLYLSTTNGESLFHYADYDGDITTINVRDGLSRLQSPLTRQFKSPPPAFHHITEFNGRMLYGVGNVVYVSDPFDYESIDSRYGFIQVEGEVRMLGAVEGGVFIGTNRKTYFLRGDDLTQALLKERAAYGVISNTMARLEAADMQIADGVDGEALIWTSARGICIGLPDGSVKNLSAGVVNFLGAHSGASIVKRSDQDRRYISVLQS